jgi:cyanophycinase
MCPSPTNHGHSRGYVIPIGGAEEKINNPDILKKFVELCGGKDANIVIIPTASKLEDTGERYEKLFEELGAGYTYSLPITKRTDAKNEDLLQHLEEATGIFITGGNQLRLSTILGGTPVAQTIRRQNAQGTHVAGTSAGAAIMSQHMIIGGSTGIVPTEDGVNLAPGLGLNNQLVIDQHFNQRNRLSRLLSAVSYNPFLIGIGLDEDTAAFINADNVFEVVGSGSVTVIDPSDCDHSSMAEARRGDAITIVNLKLHILSAGSHFDINNKVANLD